MAMRYEDLPVDILELDTTNPRVARVLEMYAESITYEQLKLALMVSPNGDADGGTTFHSLRESIRTNGGLIHPIIVNQVNEGHFVVVEGNTRTMIYKEFKTEKIEGNWENIPAIVYDKLTQAHIDAIRLQAHLVGPREWDPYSKAKYLDYLRNSQHLPFNQIIDFCGGQQQDVIRYIDAYHDMETYYRPILTSDADFDPTRFSAFVELQRGTVTHAVLDTGFTKADFAEWVDKRLIMPLTHVRSLPRILRNPNAKSIFLQDGSREAVKVLDSLPPAEVIRDVALSQLLNEIKRRIWAMPYSELRRLKDQIGSEDNESIVEARDALVQLCEDIASSD